MSYPSMTCLPVSFSGEMYEGERASTPYSRRQIRVLRRRVVAVGRDHFVARR